MVRNEDFASNEHMVADFHSVGYSDVNPATRTDMFAYNEPRGKSFVIESRDSFQPQIRARHEVFSNLHE